MKIAVIGCSHGELDCIYEDIARIENEKQITIELVIICGDFQAVRNEHDLQCMAVPHKYRQLQTFHKYYCSELTAPKLTLFIGGNHEASSYMLTLPYGGWVAKNIYYLGYASVVRYKGLRIGGISGIHHRHDSNCGHFERLPFDESTKRSIYHMRQTDVYKFMQLTAGSDDSPPESQQPLDVMISHDWPINIHSCGNVQYLLRRKPFFRNEVQNNCLGNPLLEPLVRHLKPRHWFSAHLHVRFEAKVNHTDDCQIQTKFLALDKVLPKRQYLEILDIEPIVPSESDSFEYDVEWMAILKATDKLLSIERKSSVPQLWSRLHSVEESDINKVKQLFNDDLKIPDNFEMSEPALNGRDNDSDPQRIRNYTNPQTTEFCKKLRITDPIATIIDSTKVVTNPDQISISDDEEEEEPEVDSESVVLQKRQKTDDNIDGGDLFFVDKGNDESKGDKISDSFDKEMETQIIEIIDDNIESKSGAVDSVDKNEPKPEPVLTKRQLKRRADKLKRQSELRQLEKMDKTNKKTDPNLEKRRAKKQEIRKSLEERRKLILSRIEWAKDNLPILSPHSQITFITLDTDLMTGPQQQPVL